MAVADFERGNRSSPVRRLHTHFRGEEFWRELEKHPRLQHLAPELRTTAVTLASSLSDGIFTPYLGVAEQKAAAGELLWQTDRVSCTRYSFGNALIIYDQPRPHYTPRRISHHLRKSGIEIRAHIDANQVNKLLQTEHPYNQFVDLSSFIGTGSPLDSALQYLEHLQKGGIGTLGFASTPTIHEPGHQQTVVGYVKNPETNEVNLALIDPYTPRQLDMWPLHYLLAAMAFQAIYDYKIPKVQPVTMGKVLGGFTDISNVMIHRREALAA